MSKYTMELRELFTPIKFNPPLYTKEQVEGFFKDYELSDYLTSEQIEVIEEAGIWSKDKLAKRIVNHYYMREIGQETIGLFIHTVKYTIGNFNINSRQNSYFHSRNLSSFSNNNNINKNQNSRYWKKMKILMVSSEVAPVSFADLLNTISYSC